MWLTLPAVQVTMNNWERGRRARNEREARK
jgi:hypothetical protein